METNEQVMIAENIFEWNENNEKKKKQKNKRIIERWAHTFICYILITYYYYSIECDVNKAFTLSCVLPCDKDLILCFFLFILISIMLFFFSRLPIKLPHFVLLFTFGFKMVLQILSVCWAMWVFLLHYFFLLNTHACKWSRYNA